MATPSTWLKHWSGWILIAAVISSGIAWTQQETGPAAKLQSADAANHYIDPALCTPCHSEIAARFAATGMGRSFYRMTAERAREDFTPGKTFYHKGSGSTFAMIERGGKYFQRRWQIGYDGNQTAVEVKQIDYVLGSGNHSRTYLHLTARGTLQELALSWYSERGGYFAMSPGYDTADYPGSSRSIHYECMFCHNAYPKIPKGNEEEGSEARFLGPLPEGIDCQRCHGPGGKHLEVVGQTNSTIEQVRMSIVNPARLPPEQEMEVCSMRPVNPSGG